VRLGHVQAFPLAALATASLLASLLCASCSRTMPATVEECEALYDRAQAVFGTAEVKSVEVASILGATGCRRRRNEMTTTSDSPSSMVSFKYQPTPSMRIPYTSATSTESCCVSEKSTRVSPATVSRV